MNKMKKMIFLLSVVFGLTAMQTVRSDEVMINSTDIKMIDLSKPLADARLGVAWNADGGKLGVAYIPIIYWINPETSMEYMTLNVGGSNDLATGKKDYLISIGPRIDDLFKKLSETSFAKKHLRFASLPALQISPTILTSDFKKYTLWLTIAKCF